MRNNRSIEEYLEWILEIERKLPVEKWTIDGVHVWPLLRTRINFLFFTAEKSAEEPSSQAATRQQRVLASMLKGAWALFRFLVTPMKKTPIIGSDFAAHRAIFDNKLTDKYFDPIFDYFEGRYPGLIVEYQRTMGVDTKDYYKPERILRFYEFRDLLQTIGLVKAKFSTGKYDLERYDEFLAILEKEGLDKTYYSKEYIRKTIAVIHSFKWFWKTLFGKTGAKVAIGLCFYTEPLYAMILAARETGVKSVDLQHGGQGKTHLPYAQYTKLPASGYYDLLPHYFWCWDDSSASVIQEWIDALHSKHKVFQKGHPWLDYIKSRKWPQIDGIDNIILLSLQSYDMSVAQDLIDDYLARTIKETVKEYKWFVRLHPRQLPLRDVLKAELDRLGLLNDVVVDNANDLPMPAILSRASVHMTKSSGSAIEAAIMAVPNIILDEHGAARYEEYIRQGSATLYLGKDPKALAQVIRGVIANRKSKSINLESNWDFILHLQ